MIRAARDRLEGHVRRTPLLNSPFLDEIAGRRVWVKPECLQHTGSFKFRGGWSADLRDGPARRANAVSLPFRAATMPRAWRSPPRGTTHPP
jgi:threonine dehydratase